MSYVTLRYVTYIALGWATLTAYTDTLFSFIRNLLH